MLTRAIESRVYIITSNRVGFEERGGVRLKFIDMSLAFSPNMRVLASAGVNEETVKVVNIDSSLARNKWIIDLNNIFNNRRPDLYRDLIYDP